jgi:transcriptional regulator with XRE-family HTH domain
MAGLPPGGIDPEPVDDLPTSPGAARRRLGAELRSLREAAGLRLEDAAAHLQRSNATMSRLEVGRGSAPPRLVDVAALLEYYGGANARPVPPEVRERVLRLAAESRKKQWFDPFRDVLAGDMAHGHTERYVQYETDAEDIRNYEPELIPGLLQTPAYAQAMADVFYPGRPREQRNRFAEFRVARQQVLRREPNPTRLLVAIGESALHRPLGSPEARQEQLRSLAGDVRGARANVQVWIVPLTAVLPAAVGGPFVVMSFGDGGDEDVVYLETRSGADYLTDPAAVERFMLYFDSLVEAALPTEAALALIDDAVERAR